MAKRFITTELFKDAWFMDLPNKYKLFWIFLITDCDHAGVWQVNYKTAAFYVGEHLEPGECERFLKDRIIKIVDGKYWFIPKFIDFQYGRELKYSNPAVRSVIEVLKKYQLIDYIPKTKIIEGATKELQSTLQGVKDKDKVKDKIKDENNTRFTFETFWKLYDKNTGKDKCLKRWKTISDNDKKLILNSLHKYIIATPNKQFRKNPFTYLQEKSWEDEIPINQSSSFKSEISEPYSIDKFKNING
jgi:hypothetical protein